MNRFIPPTQRNDILYAAAAALGPYLVAALLLLSGIGQR